MKFQSEPLKSRTLRSLTWAMISVCDESLTDIFFLNTEKLSQIMFNVRIDSIVMSQTHQFFNFGIKISIETILN